MQNNRGKGDEGFTLIELLVVIVILGTLSAVVVFAVGGLTDRGTSAACKSELQTVQVAVEAFRAKTGKYPDAGDSDLRIAQLTTSPNQFLKAPPAKSTNFNVQITDVNGTVTANCPA